MAQNYDAQHRQPPILVNEELKFFTDKLLNEVNGVQAGSPLRVNYEDSNIEMYKTLKIQQDLDIGEVLAKDN